MKYTEFLFLKLIDVNQLVLKNLSELHDHLFVIVIKSTDEFKYGTEVFISTRLVLSYIKCNIFHVSKP